MSAARRETCLAALALAVLVALTFAPSCSAGLVNWDDEPGIARNLAFRGLGAEQLEWMFTTSWLGPYQPLSWLSLAVDHQLWGLSRGLDAPELGAWHRTSVVLHGAAALALFAAARRLLARLCPQASARAVLLAAWLAAAAFALHPLRVESVAWLTERRDVLSGLFFALCLWAWFGWVPVRPGAAPRLRGGLAAALLAGAALLAALASLDLSRPEALALRGPGAAGLALAGALWIAAALAAGRAAPGGGSPARYLASAVLLALSLAAKGTGMLLPLALLVGDLWPLGRLAPRGARTAAGLLLEKAPLLAVSALAARLALWGQAAAGQGATLASWSEHTLGERLIQSAYALVWYVGKTALPSGLSAMHELPDQVSLASPRFALGLLLFLVGLAAALACLRRAALVPSTLAAYAILLAPVVGLSQAGAQLVAERYSYLPGMALALGLAGVALAARRLGPRARSGALLAALVWIGLLAFACERRVRVWRDSRSLWSDALATDPGNTLAAMKLAQALVEPGLAAQAGADPARALALLEAAPRDSDPFWHSTLSQVLLARARAVPAERERLLPQAVEAARRAVELQGAQVDPDLRSNLATALIEAGRFGEAVGELERFTRERPGEALGWTNLGVALAASGRAGEAVAHLERALALEPDYAKAWQFLAQARERQGDRAGASAAWRRVLELWPDSQQARARLRALAGE